MAKSPNTTPSNNNDPQGPWSMSHSYSYSYPDYANNAFLRAILNHEDDQPKHPQFTEAQRIETQNELAWLDYVESEFIQTMLTYPDAEAIINKITKEKRND